MARRGILRSCILAFDARAIRRAREANVDIRPDDFRSYYRSLSDEALLEIDANDLVAVAAGCLAEEMASRGLHPVASHNVQDAAVGDDATSTNEQAPEVLTCIVEYDFADEADLARGMLEAAEIPASLEHAPGVIRLMVPEASAEQALGILAATPLSDEELAAQAEAAGRLDDDPEADPEDDEEE